MDVTLFCHSLQGVFVQSCERAKGARKVAGLHAKEKSKDKVSDGHGIC